MANKPNTTLNRMPQIQYKHPSKCELSPYYLTECCVYYIPVACKILNVLSSFPLQKVGDSATAAICESGSRCCGNPEYKSHARCRPHHIQWPPPKVTAHTLIGFRVTDDAMVVVLLQRASISSVYYHTPIPKQKLLEQNDEPQ